MRYRIARPLSPRRLGLLGLFIVAAIALPALISLLLHIKTATTLVVPGLYVAVRWHMLASTEFMVDRSGVRLGDVGVAWDAIEHLMVRPPARGASEDQAQVDVRLRPGAANEHAVPSPVDQGTSEVHGQVRASKLNIDKLAAKMHSFAPHVQLTVRQCQPNAAAVRPERTQ